MAVTVLIVDDHSGFRSLARRLLEKEGCLVVGEAEDGASAVAVAVALEPDIILLDIQLPDHDGFEVTQQLLERVPKSQIVLISSRDSGDYGRRLETSGARGFIPKSRLSRAAIVELLGTAPDMPAQPSNEGA